MKMISNIFSDEQLDAVWGELALLSTMMHAPEDTGAAENKKSGRGIMLDETMAEVVCPTIASARGASDSLLRYSVLINHYTDGDYYKAHTDDSVDTLVILLSRAPETFTGGDLVFPDSEETVKFESNIGVVFSGELHEVTQVQAQEDSPGRYSINFFFYNDEMAKV